MPTICCPQCGLDFDVPANPACPKCDWSPTAPAPGSRPLGLLEIDVAHSGEDFETACRKIDRAIDQAICAGHKGIKVIHGYGSTGAPGLLKPRVFTYLRAAATRLGGRIKPDKHSKGATLFYF